MCIIQPSRVYTYLVSCHVMYSVISDVGKTDIWMCHKTCYCYLYNLICFFWLSVWDCSEVGKLEWWVTNFLPAKNCVLVWLCCPSSDECLCNSRAQSNSQDGANYSLPDTTRDHHLHISTVTIMTSQGPVGEVGMLGYGALESLWQHNLEEHTDLTFTVDNQSFQSIIIIFFSSQI